MSNRQFDVDEQSVMFSVQSSNLYFVDDSDTTSSSEESFPVSDGDSEFSSSEESVIMLTCPDRHQPRSLSAQKEYTDVASINSQNQSEHIDIIQVGLVFSSPYCNAASLVVHLCVRSAFNQHLLKHGSHYNGFLFEPFIWWKCILTYLKNATIEYIIKNGSFSPGDTIF